MKLYTESDLIDLVQSLKDYTHESHSILGHDEREAREFVDIFLEDREPIELPTDQEIEKEAFQVPYNGSNEFYDKSFIRGAKWVIDKIKKQIL